MSEKACASCGTANEADARFCEGCGTTLDRRCAACGIQASATARFCLVSFDTDWLYPTENSREIVHALNAAGLPVSFMELAAPFGHDSFLLEVPALDRVMAGFLSQ